MNWLGWFNAPLIVAAVMFVPTVLITHITLAFALERYRHRKHRSNNGEN